MGVDFVINLTLKVEFLNYKVNFSLNISFPFVLLLRSDIKLLILILKLVKYLKKYLVEFCFNFFTKSTNDKVWV